jgi:hypothetical protein
MLLINEILDDFFVRISVFFRSIIDAKDMTQVYRILANIIYAIIISIAFGGYYSLLFTIACGVFFKWSLYTVIPVVSITSIFLYLLLLSYFLGYRINSRFNLPELLVKISLLKFIAAITKNMVRITLFILVITLCIFIPISLLITNLPITIDTKLILYFSLFIISLIITSAIYEMSLKNDFSDSVKKFAFWLNVTLTSALAGVIILYASINTEDKILIITCSITAFIVSVISAIKTISDISKEVYSNFINEYSGNIDLIWCELSKTYSYIAIMQNIDYFLSSLIKSLKIWRDRWHNDEKKAVIKLIISELLIIIIGLLAIFNTQQITSFIEHTIINLGNRINHLYISIFNNNATLAYLYLLLILSSSLAIWRLYHLIKQFLNHKYKSVLLEIGRTSMLLLITLISISRIFNIAITELDFLFFILFSLMIIPEFLLWLIKKHEDIKK